MSSWCPSAVCSNRCGVRLASLVSAVVIGSAAGSAAASGWSAKGFLRQEFRLTVGDDEDGSNVPASSTSLGVTFSNQTPTTLFSISPGVVFTLADRADSDQDNFSVNPRLSASLAHNTPRLSLTGSISAVPQFRSDRQFDSVFVQDPNTGNVETVTETTNVDPLEIVSSGNLGLGYRLDTRNTLNTGIFFRRVDFSGDSGSLEPSTTIGGNVGLSRAIDTRTSGSMTLTYRRFMSEDEEQSDSDSFTASLGASRELTTRLNGGIDLGVTVVNDEDGLDAGFSGGVRARYRFNETFSGTFNLRQVVDQNDDGLVETVTAANGGLDYRFNERSSFGFSAGYSRSEPLASDGDASANDTVTLGARYSYRLTQDWGMNFSYGLRASNDEGDTQFSNRFLVGFSRNFDF